MFCNLRCVCFVNVVTYFGFGSFYDSQGCCGSVLTRLRTRDSFSDESFMHISLIVQRISTVLTFFNPKLLLRTSTATLLLWDRWLSVGTAGSFGTSIIMTCQHLPRLSGYILLLNVTAAVPSTTQVAAKTTSFFSHHTLFHSLGTSMQIRNFSPQKLYFRVGTRRRIRCAM